jgi:ABC-type multidrug transport system fused ATPase/permease subunit
MVVGSVCFLWSAYRLWGNHITFGEMTLFLQLSGSLSGAFGALVSLVPAAITAATAAGRIMEITRLPEEEIHSKEQVDHLLQTGSGVGIRVEDVCFAYRSGKEVFQNIVFQAEPGEVVALVGPSGGGKTTLLRLMLGMMPVQAGSIQLCGGEPELKLCASASTRALFSYVPQDNTLFSCTIAENLRITNPNATNDMLRDALRMACADEFVSALPDGLDSRVGESGDGLSKGQIQRICIARALLSDAPVLLLDEATSALDVKTERTLLENIQHFRKGRTCIVTTHRPSVLSICQRAYLIQNQAVTQVEEGKLRQMMEEF